MPGSSRHKITEMESPIQNDASSSRHHHTKELDCRHLCGYYHPGAVKCCGAHPQIFLYPTLSRRPPAQTSWPARPHHSGCPIAPPAPSPRTPPSKMNRMTPTRQLPSPPVIHRLSTTSSALQQHQSPVLRYERIGNPSLNVFRLQLPQELKNRIAGIVALSESYVEGLEGGWRTELYSLTRQDLALREIPGMLQRIRPIYDYIIQAIRVLYGCRKVSCDKNQPHILKYSVQSGHTGVELHHDRCDVTANLVLSKSQEYEGGGTFFPDAGGRVIRLEQGEFLLHPGSLVHGGMDVKWGTRYLMVLFAHLK